jgi:uncharacterized protein YwqG
METSELLKSMSEAGLDSVLPDIQKIMLESIRLSILPPTRFRPLEGISRLGGLPDLPQGFAWPKLNEIPMSFIAQIRLEDITGFAAAKNLPHVGLLSFFYDLRQETHGVSPDDRGGWAVFYFNPRMVKPLQTAVAPAGLPDSVLFTTCPLGFSSEITLPASVAQHLPNLSWSQEEINRYDDFFYTFPTSDDRNMIHHRMFGHPNQLQDDMQVQCALNVNRVPSMSDPRAAALVEKKEDWQLLLQVDSDTRSGMKWGTSGTLYYWININDLSIRKFDNTWLVMQTG